MRGAVGGGSASAGSAKALQAGGVLSLSKGLLRSCSDKDATESQGGQPLAETTVAMVGGYCSFGMADSRSSSGRQTGSL